jgi:hypothetical protein
MPADLVAHVEQERVAGQKNLERYLQDRAHYPHAVMLAPAEIDLVNTPLPVDSIDTSVHQSSHPTTP